MKPHYFCDLIIEKRLQIETAFPQSLSFINGLWTFGCYILMNDFFVFRGNVCAEVCLAGDL